MVQEKFKKLLGDFYKLLGGLYVGNFISFLASVDHRNGSDLKLKNVAMDIEKFLDVGCCSSAYA